MVQVLVSLSASPRLNLQYIRCIMAASISVSHNCRNGRQNFGPVGTLPCRYVRLELLEGVAAYYSGDKALARIKLKSSQQRWQQLQVSDERLAELMSMGFNSQEVRLGLGTPDINRFRAISSPPFHPDARKSHCLIWGWRQA